MIKIKKNFFNTMVKNSEIDVLIDMIKMIFDISVTEDEILELSVAGHLTIGEEEFKISSDKTPHGRCFIHEINGKTILHGVSAKSWSGGRNAYYAQYIKPLSEIIIAEDTEYDDSNMHLFCYDPKFNGQRMPKSIIRDIIASKCVFSNIHFHFEISNEDLTEIGKGTDPFYLQDSIMETSGKNRKNDGPKFIIQDKTVIFNYKLFGANSMQSFLYLKYLYTYLSNYSFVVYIFTGSEKSQSNIEKNTKLIQEYFPKIQIGTDKLIGNIEQSKTDTQIIIRNQTKFISNMMEIIPELKCCMCDITHSSILEAAHIMPVYKINELQLNLEEKKKMASDGNNGIWLCKNHHKLFDNNEINFDFENKKFIIDEKFMSFSKETNYNFTTENVDYFLERIN